MKWRLYTMKTTRQVFYGCSNQCPHFSGQSGSNNCGRKGHKNLTYSFDTNINLQGPEGNTTKCFTCRCKFCLVNDCLYTKGIRNKQKNSKKEKYQSIANIELRSQQKEENNGHIFLSETLGLSCYFWDHLWN